MQVVRRAEALATKILGVLLILLGLVLFVSPQVPYTKRTNVSVTPSTELTAKETRILVVPRPASVLIAGVGVLMLVLASTRPE